MKNNWKNYKKQLKFSHFQFYSVLSYRHPPKAHKEHHFSFSWTFLLPSMLPRSCIVTCPRWYETPPFSLDLNKILSIHLVNSGYLESLIQLGWNRFALCCLNWPARRCNDVPDWQEINIVDSNRGNGTASSKQRLSPSCLRMRMVDVNGPRVKMMSLHYILTWSGVEYRGTPHSKVKHWLSLHLIVPQLWLSSWIP